MFLPSALWAASCLLNYPLLPINPLLPVISITCSQQWSPGSQLSCQNLDIKFRSLAGAGGTGFVYEGITTMKSSRSIVHESVAVKVALPNTKLRLQNECEILQHLEQKHVDHVEKCLSTCSLLSSPSNSEFGDFATVLSPFKSPSTSDAAIVSSIAVIPSTKVAITASIQLIQTVIETILAGVVVTDLQFLADTVTGDVLLIDFTEARKIDINKLEYFDKQAVQSFLSEAIAFIPESVNGEVFLRAHESISRILVMFPFLQGHFEVQ